MTAQVLVKDFPCGDRYGDDDQPPINMKNGRFGKHPLLLSLWYSLYQQLTTPLLLCISF